VALFRRLSLFWKRFSPLEERLLTEVRNVIKVEARRLFDAQVAAINHVQRLPPSWGEIDFYCRPNWTRVALFPCTDEFQLAVIDNAQYLILAERQGPQFILHRVEPTGNRLYYLKHHDDIPEPFDRELETLMCK
jgi:hypothetical protein